MNPVLKESEGVEGRVSSQSEETIELFELANIMIRNRWILIGTLVLSLLAAGGYVLFTTPLYESFSVVRFGVLGDVREAEELGIRKEQLYRLRLEHDVGAPVSPDQTAWISEVEEEGVPSLIRIVATAYTPELAREKAQAAAESFVARRDVRFQTVLDMKTQHLQELEGLLAKLLGDRGETVSGEPETIVNAAIVRRLARSDEQLAMVMREILEARLGLEELQERKPIIERAASLQPDKASPRSAYVFVISVILSLILGVFLAFGREYWHIYRSRYTSP